MSISALFTFCETGVPKLLKECLVGSGEESRFQLETKQRLRTQFIVSFRNETKQIDACFCFNQFRKTDCAF